MMWAFFSRFADLYFTRKNEEDKMRKFAVVMCGIILFQYLSAAPIVKPGYKYLPDQVVVKLTKGTTSVQSVTSLAPDINVAKRVPEAVQQLVDTRRLKSPQKARDLGLDRIFIVQVSQKGDLEEYCTRLTADPGVEWAEPVYLLPMHAVPNDERYAVQHHLPQIMMPQAWDIAKGDSNVVLAIIDSGVDYLHRDLRDQIWLNPGEDIDDDGLITAVDSNNVDDDGNGFIDDFRGWDWVTGVSGGSANPDSVTFAPPWEDSEDEDNDPMDANGHGTHCAGLAAATTDNMIGVAGVSWGCKIMPLRIGWLAFDGNGYGYSTWMSQAFIYAADNGAKVANLSYGTSQAVLEGAQYAFEQDVVITTSAGNNNVTIGDALSVQPWAITVTAVDKNDYKTSYSNFGMDATVAAPGGANTTEEPGLWSTIPSNNYIQFSGTSMAAPVVAGVAGLIRSYHPDWSASQVMYQIVGTADNIDAKNPDYAGLLGGRVNSYRALTEAPVPQPKLSLEKVDLIDTDGNNNGIPEPGEKINIVVHLKNRWAPTEEATLKLLTETGEDRLTLNTSMVTIDTIPGLENPDVDIANSEAPFEVTLNSALPPSMITLRVVVENSVLSDTFSFNIPVHSLVLFVDDHLGGGDGSDAKIRSYYEDVFNQLGVVYDYWLNSTAPSSDFLAKFPIVIWACEWAFPSLNTDDRAALSDYLTNGGHLFVSGQDLAWDLADETSETNEYFNSSGASKTWLESYLNVNYLSDAGGVGPAVSAGGQSFLDLPEFAFALPDRAADNQYPDEVSPRGNAYALLKYSNGQAAAVGCEDPYSTVYFSFGGLEAITDRAIRTETARQIINHFAQLDLRMEKLVNTEFSGPFTIDVDVQTSKSLVITELWYRYNQASWQNLTMADQGSGHYTVDLPAVSEDTDIEYFVFFKTADGMYNAKNICAFHSGPDNIAPVVTEYYEAVSTVDLSGRYSVAVTLDDFVSVDTANVKVHYNVSTGYQDSIALSYLRENIWQGDILFPNALSDGDVVNYFINFNDLAQNRNYGRFPTEGSFSFTIADSALIDGFDEYIQRWDNDGTVWSLLADPALSYSGNGCLITGDGASYPAGKTTIVELFYPIDLAGRQNAKVSFMATTKLEAKTDSLFFELREGNGDWGILKILATRTSDWIKYENDLSAYCGAGHEPIWFRFRFQPDAVAEGVNRWGVKIDDLIVVTNRPGAAVHDMASVPRKFQLLAAYPNPFNSMVTIPYAVPASGEVQIRIFNLLGQSVYDIKTNHLTAGYYNYVWDGRNNSGSLLTSGVYFIKVGYQNRFETKKVLYLK